MMSWTCLRFSSFGSPLVLKVGIFGALLFLTGVVTSQGQMPPTTPTTGMVCISDCATCPVICSSPPPLSMSSYQPPLPQLPTPPPPPLPVHGHHPPPKSYYYSSPPPPSLELTPPAPPLQTQLPPPDAPSMYPSWGAPPPPFKYSNNVPSGLGTPGTGMGGHDYSYPYYYFYASEAASVAGYCNLFMLLLFPCYMILGYG